MLKRFQLRKQLISFMILTVLITMCFFALMTYRFFSARAHDTYQRDAQDMIQRLEQNISRFLEERLAYLVKMHRLTDDESWPILFDIMKSRGYYGDSFILDTDGRVVASNNPLYVGYAYPFRQEFREAISTLQPFISSGIQRVATTNILLIVVPVIREDKLAYIAWHEIDLRQTEYLIREEIQGFAGNAFIVNREGNVIFDYLSGKSEQPSSSPRSLHSYGLLWGSFVGDSGSFQQTVNGSPFFFSYRSSEILQGIVVSQVPMGQLQESIFDIAYIVAIVLFFTLLITFPIAFFLSKLGLRPIQALSEELTQVMRGNQESLSIQSKSELSIIARSFNQAWEENRSFQTQLTEKARELEEKNLELLEANEKALAASKAKSSFLSNMSHEIRTPLAAVIGLAELLADTSLNEEQRSFVQRIHLSSESLLSIVNDILDFSKIEEGKVHIESYDFDLYHWADQVVAIFAQQAKDKGLALRTEIEPDVPRYLSGDPSRLSQIMVNLVGNAIKFTLDGSIHVRFRTERTDHEEDSDTLVVSVEDTGIGIPKEKQQEIFDSFTQADTSTTRQFGGTGLGLSITKRLVELMGGRIELESQPGKGSCFTFRLPLIEATTTPQAPVKEVVEVLNESVPLKILVAEDTESNQILIQAFLEGDELDIVEDGTMALESAKSHTYDLILMDLQMPNMDGFEATRKIREWERETGRKRTPIFALSAYAMEHETKKSADAGCDLHLTKPIKKDTLLNAIIPVRNQKQAKGDGEPHKTAHTIKVDKLLQPIFPKFLANLEKDILQIQDALERADYLTIQRLGHSMKGAGGGYGLDRVSEIGLEIEQAARSTDPAKIRIQIDHLQAFLGNLNLVFE